MGFDHVRQNRCSLDCSNLGAGKRGIACPICVQRRCSDGIRSRNALIFSCRHAARVRDRLAAGGARRRCQRHRSGGDVRLDALSRRPMAHGAVLRALCGTRISVPAFGVVVVPTATTGRERRLKCRNASHRFHWWFATTTRRLRTSPVSWISQCSKTVRSAAANAGSWSLHPVRTARRCCWRGLRMIFN